MFSPTAHVRFETEKTRFRKNNIIIIFFRVRQMQLFSFREFRIFEFSRMRCAYCSFILFA